MQLSKGQQNMFWKEFQRAWRGYCDVSGQDPDDAAARDAWRRDAIRRATGASSLKAVGRGGAFDRLMIDLAAAAGDFALAANIEVNQAERIRFRCADCARQICEIDGRAGLETDEERWRYVAGVAAQAYRGRAWLDIPEADLARVFMMLDTYRRRLLKRAGWRGGRAYPNEPLGFELGRRFGRDGPRVVLLDDSVGSGIESGTQESRKERQEVCA